jgi:hypothetical protein
VTELTAAAWTERQIAEERRQAWKLVVEYNYDIHALLDAAWALPITFKGNQEARNFYYATDLLKTFKRENQA